MKILAILVLGFSLMFAAVDINSASAKELITLKGIGSKRAEAIIAYRKAHCFTSVDELIKVKGIGKKFLQNNKKNLKADPCKISK